MQNSCTRTRDIKIVFISSHQNYEYFRYTIQYRWEDYLLKPIKSGDILNCFGKYGSIWMKNMQCPGKQREIIMSKWLQL